MLTTQCSTIVEDDVPSELIDYMLARGSQQMELYVEDTLQRNVLGGRIISDW